MLRPALLLLSLVTAACSGPPPSAPPAQSGPTPDVPPPAEPAPADEPENDAGGFASPELGEPSPEPEVPAAMKDPALIARVKQRFGESCRPERSCGDMLGVDCNAAVDGPYYYVDHADLKVVSTCGGACMRGCTDCPPKAWACATY